MLLYNARKHNSGFTLIEMLIVTVIIGVIAAIAAPNLLGLLNRNRVNQAARQVEGALRESKANLGIAISGIAGPGGGTPARPVGTVCIAWKLDQASTIRETFLFEGNRNEVRYQTVFKALEVAIELVN